MSLESSIEEQIQKAITRGEFDNLKGKGKPLDLTAYFNTPEDLRMAYSLLKSNQFIPGEVDLIKEIATLKNDIAKCTDETTKAIFVKKLNEKSLSLNLTLEKYKRKR
jgi:hypothetical protein